VLFAVGFDRRHKHRSVRATAVQPGVIRTELGRHMTPELTQTMVEMIAAAGEAARMKSIAQGAATSVWSGIVASADAVGGRYCEDCHLAEITPNDPSVHGGVLAYALDPARAEALWAKSEEMVGERF
jgi:NAD(P)-dependent dehydrogenase (short-subunit alcohol dehydrogenase family)